MRAALGDVTDIARAHVDAVTRLATTTGGLYAPARTVELTPERVEAHIRGRYVPVQLTDITTVRTGYDAAAGWTAAARGHLSPHFANARAAYPAEAPSTVLESRTVRNSASP